MGATQEKKSSRWGERACRRRREKRYALALCQEHNDFGDCHVEFMLKLQIDAAMTSWSTSMQHLAMFYKQRILSLKRQRPASSTAAEDLVKFDLNEPVMSTVDCDDDDATPLPFDHHSAMADEIE